jgi:transmembrane sensor
MDNKEKAALLISKYLEGQCSEEEKILVERFYLDQYKQQPLNNDLHVPENLKSDIWMAIDNNIARKSKRSVISLRMSVAIAASVLIFVSAGFYFHFRTHVKVGTMAKNVVPDFAPAASKAILTLSNGEQVVLNRAQKGSIALQGGTIVKKLADGELVYTQAKSVDNAADAYNTVSIPRGGRQYHLVLSDGTAVWLNAASSIKYPASFNSKTRLVRLEGEAYFEVAHDPARPFRVSSRGQSVEVLGTHFNINAYDDEPLIKTTLMAGSIRVYDKDRALILTPGQQSLAGNGSLLMNTHPDLEQVLAWKNNEFNFYETDIQSIMRQLSRWYDFDVEFRTIPDKRMSGTFSRDMNASNVLKMLDFLGVKFKIEGRKITIL